MTAALKATEEKSAGLEIENVALQTKVDQLSGEFEKATLSFTEQQTSINALTEEKAALDKALTLAKGDLEASAAQVKALSGEKDKLTADIAAAVTAKAEFETKLAKRIPIQPPFRPWLMS